MALPAEEDGSSESAYAGPDNDDVEPIGPGSGRVAIGDCMRDPVGFHGVRATIRLLFSQRPGTSEMESSDVYR